jgi:hypothetical protein
MVQLSKDLQKASEKCDAFENQVKGLTKDETAKAPILEAEQQTKISQKEIDRTDGVYLKPERSISCSPKDTFNEKWRDDYNYRKEYVRFIAENKEVIGDSIEKWTRPFPGMPAEFWRVPTNKVVIGPRYLAEEISKCAYTRLVMEDRPTGSSSEGTYYGQLVASNRIQRLDAKPAAGFNKRASAF